MRRSELYITLLVAFGVSFLYFLTLYFFPVPLEVQLVIFLIPFFVGLRFGIPAGVVVASLILVVFVYENPPREELLAWYLILGVISVLVGVLGGIIRDYRMQQKRLFALFQAAQLLASVKSLEEISKEVIKILEKDLGYHHAAIAWVKGDFLELAYAKDYVIKAGLKTKVGEGVTGKAVQEGKVLLVPDVRKFPSYIPGLSGAKSELACPIKVKEKVVGVINLESRKKAAFRKEDIQLLQAFSKIVAVAWENAMLHEKLFNEAITDPLTGLYNRRYFFKRLQEEISRAQRYGSKFGLLLLDLKDFKKINDNLGHEKGDELLKAFAEKLQRNVRKVDIVARYGGDEFVVLLIQTNKNGIKAVMGRLAREISEIEVEGFKIRANIGAALYPEDGELPNELLRKADDRMYLAKKANRLYLLPWESLEA